MNVIAASYLSQSQSQAWYDHFELKQKKYIYKYIYICDFWTISIWHRTQFHALPNSKCDIEKIWASKAKQWHASTMPIYSNFDWHQTGVVPKGWGLLSCRLHQNNWARRWHVFVWPRRSKYLQHNLHIHTSTHIGQWAGFLISSGSKSRRVASPEEVAIQTNQMPCRNPWGHRGKQEKSLIAN